MAFISCVTNSQDDNCLCPIGSTRTLYHRDNSTWLCCNNINPNNSENRILSYHCVNSGYSPFSMQLYRWEFNNYLQRYSRPNANGICSNGTYFLSYTTGVPIPRDGEVCMPNSVEGSEVYLTDIGLFPVTFYTQNAIEIERPVTFPARSWGVLDGRICGTCPDGMYCDQFRQECVPLDDQNGDVQVNGVEIADSNSSSDRDMSWIWYVMIGIIIVLLIVLIVYLVKRRGVR